jgi:hypothetical protein
MANDALAVLSTAQILLRNELELIAGNYQTYLAYKQNAQGFFPGLKESRLNESRAADLIYNKKASRALTTGRTEVIASPATGDSAKLTPSWIVRKDNIRFGLKRAGNSLMSADERLYWDLKQVFINFMEDGETMAVDHLFNNRTHITAAPNSSEQTWNATTFIHDINESTVGSRAMLIQDLILAYNDYSGVPMDVIADPIAINKFKYAANQGSGNSDNKGFQYAGINFIPSFKLTAKATSLSLTKGIWATVPRGNYGCITDIPLQNKLATPTTVKEKYGSIINPIDNDALATWSYEEAFDGTSTGGQRQDIDTKVQFSKDYCFEVMPLSTPTQSPILFYAFV